jgi:hypothetical protein
MTEADTVEAGAAPAPKATEPSGPPEATRPSFMKRVLDWHLCRPQILEARRVARQSPREAALLGRAKSALAAGNHLLEAPERTGHGLAAAHAAVLYIESLYWSLLSSRTDLDKPEPDALWAAAQPVTDELRLSAEQASEVKRFLAMPKPALEIPELTQVEQESGAMVLRQAASRALEVRERPKRAVEALSLTSLLRIGLTLAVLVALVAGLVALVPAKKNLLAGKPWTASSKMFDCNPEAGECGGVQTMIFFHTLDEPNPWVRYDLGSKTQFSSMTIKNRQDGNRDRAVPLVVEVSDDGSSYKEIARQNEEFSVWKPSFSKQSARYVRLRVPRKTILHLESVQIHP